MTWFEPSFPPVSYVGNPADPDTIGPEESVLIRKMSSFDEPLETER